MSFLSRLFGKKTDQRDELRPLWFRVVEISRLREYYAQSGVADTLEGRFDMVVTVLTLVILRMETSRPLASKTALLTELFVEDMDGQLRESGVGDVVVGKHMGKLMSALGGRMGALRSALDSDDMAELAATLERNVTWSDAPDPQGLAVKLRALHDDLKGRDNEAILEGRIAQ